MGVFLAYAPSDGARALIDRELYLPAPWTGDRVGDAGAHGVVGEIEHAAQDRMGPRPGAASGLNGPVLANATTPVPWPGTSSRWNGSGPDPSVTCGLVLAGAAAEEPEAHAGYPGVGLVVRLEHAMRRPARGTDVRAGRTSRTGRYPYSGRDPGDVRRDGTIGRGPAAGRHGRRDRGGHVRWRGSIRTHPPTMMSLEVVVGGMTQRPRAVNGRVEIRDVLDLTPIIDHNVVDGAPATRFGAELRELIETAAVISPPALPSDDM